MSHDSCVSAHITTHATSRARAGATSRARDGTGHRARDDAADADARSTARAVDGSSGMDADAMRAEWRIRAMGDGRRRARDALDDRGDGGGTSSTARAGAGAGARREAMGRRREHGLWRRRFLNELSSATAHAECTLADACELAYGCERLREVFRRAHGAENEDGGGTREGWRARFERATPRDVAAALGEIRGLLKVVDEETYARGIDGDAHVAIEGDEPMGERGRGRAGARRAECPFCKKKFVESHLPSHVAKQHTGARPVKCSHVGCDEYFADERAMRRHVVLIHEQKYKCGVCGKAFSTKQMQERHEDSAHAERKKTIPCPVDGCTVMFSNVGSISDHMKRAHSNAKPYACTYPGCSAKFATSSDKARHFRTHFGDNARPGAASRSMSVHLSQSRSELVRKRARARSFEDDLVPELTDPSLMSKWLLVGGDEASEL